MIERKNSVAFIKMVLRMKINYSSLPDVIYTSDVDECLAWTFDCEDDSQMCENTYGSYKCVCAEGLYWIDGQCKGEMHLNHCTRKRLFTIYLLTHLTRTLQEVGIENDIQISLRHS